MFGVGSLLGRLTGRFPYYDSSFWVRKRDLCKTEKEITLAVPGFNHSIAWAMCGADARDRNLTPWRTFLFSPSPTGPTVKLFFFFFLAVLSLSGSISPALLVLDALFNKSTV